jgi:two-component system LytT family response regulator
LPELRVVLADDEPLVRSGMRSLLDDEPDVLVVAEARNGVEAVEAIREHLPDVVFLDVQMPGMDGFGVVAALEPTARPSIVFVTAYDEYAIRAFDVHAVDYLLKPFDAERFRLALSRARSRRTESRGTTPAVDERIEALLAELRPGKRYADRLLLKHEGSVVVVLAADIDWIEAADNYVKVHARSGRYMVRESIKSLESKLDPAQFARAHRSAIVNLDRVRSLEPVAAGENRITLSTGMRLTLSRGYRDSFRLRLEGR